MRAEETRARLAAVQDWLRAEGHDGLFVPRSDFWQGEEVMTCDERLRWLTGFSGSAGMALVLCDTTALFVDGRYPLQAAQETAGTDIEIRHFTQAPWQDWMALPVTPKLAVDGKLVTGNWAADTTKQLAAKGGSLTLLDSNPIDALWQERPAPSFTPVSIYPEALAGQSSVDKRAQLAAQLQSRQLDAALITDPAGIAWLLNIRAQDYAHTPVALSVALLRADSSLVWFTTPERNTPELQAHLGPNTRIETQAAWAQKFAALKDQTVLVDEATAAVWLEQQLGEAGAIFRRERCITALPKAQKNPVELNGMRVAHQRDGVAMARFLNWYDTTVAPGQASLRESEIVRQLADQRGRSNEYRGPSFETICGHGPHGAIVHYHTTTDSDIKAEGDTLLLLDSGGQYNDGTTDITRTLPVGKPGAVQREAYTRVLQGHIALATARFPAGTNGHQLDAIARAPLWHAGMDYEHGTGHGVGHYLSVHEGPARITKYAFHQGAALIPLEPGMVLSNEPGYYEAGAYGIRIETLIAVVESEPGAGNKPFLEFETLTLVPYARALIITALLTPAERGWLDTYHARVLHEIGPQLAGEALSWLTAACAPL